MSSENQETTIKLSYEEDEKTMSEKQLEEKKIQVWKSFIESLEEIEFEQMYGETYKKMIELDKENNYDIGEFLIQMKKDLVTKFFRDCSTLGESKEFFAKHCGFTDYIPRKFFPLSREIIWLYNYYKNKICTEEEFEKLIKLPKIKNDTTLEEALAEC